MVGTAIGLSGRQHTVVGVLEPDAEIGGLSLIDVWTPLGLDVAQTARDERTLRVAGRLKPGVTLSSRPRLTSEPLRSDWKRRTR